MVAMLPMAGQARPPGTTEICRVYPDAPLCVGGVATCAACHATPPARNPYGAQIEGRLAVDLPRPLDDAAFTAHLEAALRAVEDLDADGDGATNRDELEAGTLPYDRTSAPADDDRCAMAGAGPPAVGYDTCRYDPRFAYRKVLLDVCGRSPTMAELDGFSGRDDPRAAIGEALDTCLASAFWRGRDGVLWNLANERIEPLAALKSGAGAGPIPLGDYDDDYALFVYTHSGDRDVRDILVARYFVEWADDGEMAPFDRTPVEEFLTRDEDVAQIVPRARRAGMLTTRWFLVRFTMFTAVPRTTAAWRTSSFQSASNSGVGTLRRTGPSSSRRTVSPLRMMWISSILLPCERWRPVGPSSR